MKAGEAPLVALVALTWYAIYPGPCTAASATAGRTAAVRVRSTPCMTELVELMKEKKELYLKMSDDDDQRDHRPRMVASSGERYTP